MSDVKSSTTKDSKSGSSESRLRFNSSSQFDLSAHSKVFSRVCV
jgi:hypothetical protein